MAKLTAAMLAIQTVGEMYALMEDYSYMEFMQTYSQLTPQQQVALDAIYDGDCQMQMASISGSAQEPLAVRPIFPNLHPPSTGRVGKAFLEGNSSTMMRKVNIS